MMTETEMWKIRAEEAEKELSIIKELRNSRTKELEQELYNIKVGGAYKLALKIKKLAFWRK
jgi:hypothetical protein